MREKMFANSNGPIEEGEHNVGLSVAEDWVVE